MGALEDMLAAINGGTTTPQVPVKPTRIAPAVAIEATPIVQSLAIEKPQKALVRDYLPRVTQGPYSPGDFGTNPSRRIGWRKGGVSAAAIAERVAHNKSDRRHAPKPTVPRPARASIIPEQCAYPTRMWSSSDVGQGRVVWIIQGWDGAAPSSEVASNGVWTSKYGPEAGSRKPVYLVRDEADVPDGILRIEGADEAIYNGSFHYVPGSDPSRIAWGWGEREFARVLFAYPNEDNVFTTAIHETGRILGLWHRTSIYRLKNDWTQSNTSEYRWIMPS